MKYTATLLSFAVHKSDASPLFGEDTLRVHIEDHGGGPFLVLEREDAGEQLQLDFDEFMAIYRLVIDTWLHPNSTIKTPEAEQMCDD